jgi:hypothetical protein
MSRLVAVAMLGALFIEPGEARACGGAFGSNYSIDPAQSIVVGHHQGTETYVFNPRFCGDSDSFGLILPVPTVLTQNPTLGSSSLYRNLEALAAPNIVVQNVCANQGAAAPGSGSKSNGIGATPDGGTTVVDRGQVGIFDWALLQASSITSFTDWLDANGFPYQSDAPATFQYYVTSGWYFVAFKVSAGTDGGTAGTLCGNFGPVMVSFSAPEPVVPARIATVSSSAFRWTVYTLAPNELKLRDLGAERRFSGAVGSAYSSLTGVGQPGDRLTELLVTSVPDQDLILVANPDQADLRRTEYQYQYVFCGTGGTGGGGGQAPQATSGPSHDDSGCAIRPPRASTRRGLAALLAALGALGLFARRRATPVPRRSSR